MAVLVFDPRQHLSTVPLDLYGGVGNFDGAIDQAISARKKLSIVGKEITLLSTAALSSGAQIEGDIAWATITHNSTTIGDAVLQTDDGADNIELSRFAVNNDNGAGVIIRADESNNIHLDHITGTTLKYSILVNDDISPSGSYAFQKMTVTNCDVYSYDNDAFEFNCPVNGGWFLRVRDNVGKTGFLDVNDDTGAVDSTNGNGVPLNVSGNPVWRQKNSGTGAWQEATATAGFIIGVAYCLDVVIDGNSGMQSRLEALHIEDTWGEVTISNNHYEGLYDGGIKILTSTSSQGQTGSILCQGNVYKGTTLLDTVVGYGLEMVNSIYSSPRRCRFIGETFEGFERGMDIGGPTRVLYSDGDTDRSSVEIHACEAVSCTYPLWMSEETNPHGSMTIDGCNVEGAVCKGRNDVLMDLTVVNHTIPEWAAATAYTHFDLLKVLIPGSGTNIDINGESLVNGTEVLMRYPTSQTSGASITTAELAKLQIAGPRPIYHQTSGEGGTKPGARYQGTYTFTFKEAQYTSTTDKIAILDMGGRFVGNVKVTPKSTNPIIDTLGYEISWDGTTFAVTTEYEDNSSNVTSLSFTEAGGILYMQYSYPIDREQDNTIIIYCEDYMINKVGLIT